MRHSQKHHVCPITGSGIIAMVMKVMDYSHRYSPWVQIKDLVSKITLGSKHS